MKVKLSYTVEFDDVPFEIQRILDSKTNLQYATIIDSIHKSLQQNNHIEAISRIENLREKLNAVDLTLSDCHSILTGYVKALTDKNNDESNGN